MRDAFHQAAIAHESPSAVIDDGQTFAIELRSQQLFGQCHADRIGNTLPQRARGGFYAQMRFMFRVTGGVRTQLAEGAQVVYGQRIAAQVQNRIQQHRGVTIGEHEAIAVDPGRIGWVVAQEASPQHFGDVGHAHGGTRMSGIGLLDGVHGQGSDGVGQLLMGRHGGEDHSRCEESPPFSCPQPLTANPCARLARQGIM